jgi:flagellar hook-associated protein 2
VAGTSSISGLASGFDSTTVISQLMSIESGPQTLLKSKLSAAQTKTTAYQAINSSFAALLSSAKTAASAATWTATAASSSNSTVSASAGAAAQTGSLAFSVTQLAAAHSVVSSQTWSSTTTDTLMGASLTLSTAPTKPITLDTDADGKTTLAEAVAAINASTATSGITATAVNTGGGYKLQLTAATTGAAARFTPTTTGSTGFDLSVQGQDAQLQVGTTAAASGGNPATTAYTVTSASNTFTDVLAGTTFTVSKAGESATISVTSNPSAATTAVNALVNAANSTLKVIASYATASGDDADTDGILAGDYSMKQLKSAVLDAVTKAVGGKSAASAGLEVDRYGAITFNSTTFTAALKANPAGVQAIFQGAVGTGADNVADTVDDVASTDGIAARLAVLAADASDKVNGSLTVMAKGQTDRAKDLKAQISDWDTRLALRQSTLTAKFTAMESALATLSSQGSWLSSQIDGLPSWSD